MVEFGLLVTVWWRRHFGLDYLPGESKTNQTRTSPSVISAELGNGNALKFLSKNLACQEFAPPASKGLTDSVWLCSKWWSSRNDLMWQGTKRENRGTVSPHLTLSISSVTSRKMAYNKMAIFPQANRHKYLIKSIMKWYWTKQCSRWRNCA